LVKGHVSAARVGEEMFKFKVGIIEIRKALGVCLLGCTLKTALGGNVSKVERGGRGDLRIAPQRCRLVTRFKKKSGEKAKRQHKNYRARMVLRFSTHLITYESKENFRNKTGSADPKNQSLSKYLSQTSTQGGRLVFREKGIGQPAVGDFGGREKLRGNWTCWKYGVPD